MKKKIVVIEDNRPIREMVEYLLTESGYDVVTANDSGTGIDAAHASQPDLVLLDLQLPGMDGFDVLKTLRNDGLRDDVPIVAFTAYVMVGEKQRILSAGFDGYISKPIDPEAFLVEIARYVSRGPS